MKTLTVFLVLLVLSQSYAYSEKEINAYYENFKAEDTLEKQIFDTSSHGGDEEEHSGESEEIGYLKKKDTDVSESSGESEEIGYLKKKDVDVSESSGEGEEVGYLKKKDADVSESSGESEEIGYLKKKDADVSESSGEMERTADLTKKDVALSGRPLHQYSDVFIRANTKAFKIDCLRTTNRLRRRHKNTPLLAWNRNLARKAVLWAKHLLKIGKLEHSHVKGEGENLYYSRSRSKPKCSDVVIAWYSEIKNYNFAAGESNGGVIGHFTQLVWKSTRKIGVGIATKKDKKGYYTTYIVAKFTPPGNWLGEYKTNVMPVKAGAAPATPAPTCKNVNHIKKCKYLTKSKKYGPCTNPKSRSYFEKNCRKLCGFC